MKTWPKQLGVYLPLAFILHTNSKNWMCGQLSLTVRAVWAVRAVPSKLARCSLKQGNLLGHALGSVEMGYVIGYMSVP